MKDFPDFIPGEEEFQNGNYAASIPGLLAAFYAGHPRAPYYARIIFEHGLDGRPPNPAEARKALQIMTLRYVDAKRYARQGPGSKRALFQATLGLLHYKGLVPGQARDVTRARKWAETAAGSGFTPAMDLSASVICDSGMTSGFLGFGSGPGDCFSWTLKAAEKGDILAMANLSYLYRDGVGTPRDPLRAVSWAHKAATMNPPSPRAQNDMGAYYLLAQAVSPDPTEAGRWFSLAQGRYPLARRNLAKAAGGGAPELETDIDY
jgi:TPR repeat protein